MSLEQTCKILSSYRFMNSDDNLYSCHICEAKLRGRQTLYEHIRGTHLCAHIYRCPNCGLSFKWRSGLQRHRTRCTNVGSVPPVIDMWRCQTACDTWCSNAQCTVDLWRTYVCTWLLGGGDCLVNLSYSTWVWHVMQSPRKFCSFSELDFLCQVPILCGLACSS